MKQAPFKKRALCLWLPHWRLERVYSGRPELRRSAMAIYEEHRPGIFRVVACSELARRQGVRTFMPLTEATALASLHLEKFDPQRDHRELVKLAEWCHEFSPAVAIEEPDCLLMDVTGLEPLFGSELHLVDLIQRAFAKRRLTIQIAITDTFAGAWALSHCSGQRVVIVPPQKGPVWLYPLSISGLKLSESTLATLLELGVETIGQLAALPRESLASRFEADLLVRLQQALGERPEAVNFHYTQPKLLRTLEFAGPVSDRATLGRAVVELLSQFIPLLKEKQVGITRLVCQFLGEQPNVQMIVGLYQPTTSIRHLGELALLHLEQLKFFGPIERVRILICGTSRLRSEQLEMFDEENLAEQKRQLSLLVDRLNSRLGFAAVLKPKVMADAQAEFACRYQSVSADSKRVRNRSLHPFGPLERPVQLLPTKVPLEVLGVLHGPPSQFHWRGQTYKVKRSWGPERIQAGWWRGTYEKRDYYRVETAEGNRYWLYCRGDGAWFLHGIFD